MTTRLDPDAEKVTESLSPFGRRLRLALLASLGLLVVGVFANESLVADWPNGLDIYTRNFGARATTSIQPDVIHRVEPVYPSHLKRMNIEGVVTASYTIDIDGSVLDVAVSGSSYSEFREAVKSAVEQWRFEPPRMHGAAIRVERSVEVRFERPECHRMAKVPLDRVEGATRKPIT